MNSNFRKTSQSMYQPGPNKSALGTSKFNIALEGSGLMGNKTSIHGSCKIINLCSEKNIRTRHAFKHQTQSLTTN